MDDKETADVEMISEWPVVDNSGALKVKSSKSLNERKSWKRKYRECQPDLSYSEMKVKRHYEEPLAHVSVSKWWRKQTTETRQKYPLPKSQNPNTKLSAIFRLDVTKKFMKDEVDRLRKSLKQYGPLSSIHAALGSFFEKLGDTEAAKKHLQSAVASDDSIDEYRWLLGKICKQVEVMEKQRQAFASLPEKVCMPIIKQVERVSADDLTAEQFYHNYSTKHKPVVITDLLEKMTEETWNLNHIKCHAGTCSVTLKQPVQESCEWAKLETMETVSVMEYIQHIQSSSSEADKLKDKASQGYLFDWSLPINCPQLVKQLKMPRYFAGDFLQRTREGSLYKDSWPSLFIAPRGVCSELHVDAFNSNFWMAVFEGRKRWVFFPPSDVPYLYPRYEHSLDPVFEVDLVFPDLEKHPLLHNTHPSECILSEGEVLFVPAGCPHRVENLTNSLAVSANFVDLSNLDGVLRELSLNALLDPRADDLLTQFQSCDFNKQMNFYDTDLDWSKFKSQNVCTLNDNSH